MRRIGPPRIQREPGYRVIFTCIITAIDISGRSWPYRITSTNMETVRISSWNCPLSRFQDSFCQVLMALRRRTATSNAPHSLQTMKNCKNTVIFCDLTPINCFKQKNLHFCRFFLYSATWPKKTALLQSIDGGRGRQSGEQPALDPRDPRRHFINHRITAMIKENTTLSTIHVTIGK